MGQPGCNDVGHDGRQYDTTDINIIQLCKDCDETDCEHVGSDLCGHRHNGYCNHGGYNVKEK